MLQPATPSTTTPHLCQAKPRQQIGDVKVGECAGEHVAVKSVQQPTMPWNEVARVLYVYFCVCGGGGDIGGVIVGVIVLL